MNQIDNNLSNRYYIALSDKKNKFLLGLANTDVYESNNFLKIPNISNKFIIFDLNFSKIYLEKAIRNLSYKNKIIVCATSVYKIINSSKPDIGFLCMILPIADGTIFVKLTSDIEGIKLLENKFMSFCSSFKMNDE